MEPYEIVGKFELLKHEVQKILYGWLVVNLPNLDLDRDWNQYVLNHLSAMQKRIIEELNYEKDLKQLDFAMLLSVILGNWTRLRNITGFTKGNRIQFQQMKDSRNRWSHLPTEDIENYSPVGINRDYVIIDLTTMKILISAICHDHPVIGEIEVLMQGLHNGAVPDLNSDTTTLRAHVLNPATSTLPIHLEPEDSNTFKCELIRTQRANIAIQYSDGTSTDQVWNATNINEHSNIKGNLRSRSEFRQGNWQRNNIVNVVVTIIE